MGVEIETDGIGEGWYEQGQYENVSIVDAATVEGLFFEGVVGGVVRTSSPFEVGFVGGIEINTLLGLGVTWLPKAKEIEIHGRHAVATSPESKNYNVINYTCTSEQSHTQTVNGPTTWTNNGEFTLMALTPTGKIAMSTVNTGTIFLGASNGQLSLAAATTSLRGDATAVTGTTSAQLSGGGNSVLLNAAEASLLCNTAGIKATTASTVISGAKVEIGLPNGPVSVATQAQTVELQTNIDNLQAETQQAITALQEQLNNLKTKCVARASILAALA